MTFNKTTQFFRFLLLPLLLCLGLTAFAQNKAEKSEYKARYKNRGFCENHNYSNDNKVSFNELREATVAAGGLVNVDARHNGGINVKGENRSDVLVRSCIQTWGASDEEARAVAKSIRIETGSTIQANGANEESNWSVSYEILAPRNSDLKLLAHNGGISISSVEGNVEFETINGGVNLRDVAGDVKGRTKNGGVNVDLTGNAWRGNGLDVETTNGGVNLSMPENYAARVETGTVNGGFKSEIGGLSVAEDDKEQNWNRKKRISTDLNGGGAPIRVVTTNGGIRINAAAGRNL